MIYQFQCKVEVNSIITLILKVTTILQSLETLEFHSHYSIECLLERITLNVILVSYPLQFSGWHFLKRSEQILSWKMMDEFIHRPKTYVSLGFASTLSTPCVFESLLDAMWPNLVLVWYSFDVIGDANLQVVHTNKRDWCLQEDFIVLVFSCWWICVFD